MLAERVGAALKEWAVTIRALREGRQVFVLRKGGLYDAGGEFSMEARTFLLLPTYIHEEERARTALQPCYRAWLDDVTKRRPAEGFARIEAVATLEEAVEVRDTEALFALHAQHIHSDDDLRLRLSMQPERPLWALFLRVWNLSAPATFPLEPQHYGCKSWTTLPELPTEGAVPALSETTFSERVRVTRRYLLGERNT